MEIEIGQNLATLLTTVLTTVGTLVVLYILFVRAR